MPCLWPRRQGLRGLACGPPAASPVLPGAVHGGRQRRHHLEQLLQEAAAGGRARRNARCFACVLAVGGAVGLWHACAWQTAKRGPMRRCAAGPRGSSRQRNCRAPAGCGHRHFCHFQATATPGMALPARRAPGWCAAARWSGQSAAGRAGAYFYYTTAHCCSRFSITGSTLVWAKRCGWWGKDQAAGERGAFRSWAGAAGGQARPWAPKRAALRCAALRSKLGCRAKRWHARTGGEERGSPSCPSLDDHGPVQQGRGGTASRAGRWRAAPGRRAHLDALHHGGAERAARALVEGAGQPGVAQRLLGAGPLGVVLRDRQQPSSQGSGSKGGSKPPGVHHREREGLERTANQPGRPARRATAPQPGAAEGTLGAGQAAKEAARASAGQGPAGYPTLSSRAVTKSLASWDTSFHALRRKLGCSVRIPFQMTAAAGQEGSRSQAVGEGAHTGGGRCVWSVWPDSPGVRPAVQRACRRRAMLAPF